MLPKNLIVNITLSWVCESFLQIIKPEGVHEEPHICSQLVRSENGPGDAEFVYGVWSEGSLGDTVPSDVVVWPDLL